MINKKITLHARKPLEPDLRLHGPAIRGKTQLPTQITNPQALPRVPRCRTCTGVRDPLGTSCEVLVDHYEKNNPRLYGSLLRGPTNIHPVEHPLHCKSGLDSTKR